MSNKNLPTSAYLSDKRLPKEFDKEGSVIQVDTDANFEFYFEYDDKNPEKCLWLNTLGQAIWDYKELIQNGKKELADVFDWFFNCDNYEPGSFFYVCETLSINSNYFLKQLILWSKANYEVV